ncbi:MAG: alkaline phosphatase family protein, partial [Gammaproteobacteria bacterium]
MTGKNPGKHGIFHFIGMDPESYDVHYINARSRKSQTIWKLFNEAQKTVGVLNVPFTFPPEPVDGYMMSGMDTPDEKSDFIHPASLREELEERGELRLDIRYLGYMTSDERRDAVLQGLREIDEQRTATALYLMERYPTDLVMIVYTSTDTAAHYFWHYMDREHPFFDAQGAQRYGRAILEVYQRLDQTIGELLARLPEETAVVLVSDHGNGPTSDRVLHLNRYLDQLGLLKFQSDGTGRGRLKRLVQALVKRLDLFLRGNLSAQQKVKLAQLFPRLRRKWESYYSSTANIDWAATKAYGVEILASPPAIHINLKGVKPQGSVEKEEYEDLVEFLIKRLYELKDPKTGRQLIKKVYRREEIYHGPYVERAPDLTLAWWEDGTFNAKPSAPGEERYPVVGSVQKTGGLKSEWSGNHLLHGILLLKGNPFRPGLALEGARIIDMAPTLLYL